MIEVISFDGGINTKQNPIYLKETELVSSEGWDYDVAGVLDARTPKAKVNDTAVGSINGVHRNINMLYVTDDGNIRYKWDLDGYCNLYTGSNDFTLSGIGKNARPKFVDFNGFTFVITGGDNKVLVNNNMCSWGMPVVNEYMSHPGTEGGSGGAVNQPIYHTHTFTVNFPNGYACESPPAMTSVFGTWGSSPQGIVWALSSVGVHLSFLSNFPGCSLSVNYFRSQGASSASVTNSSPLYNVGSTGNQDNSFGSLYMFNGRYPVWDDYGSISVLTRSQLSTDVYDFNISKLFVDASSHLSRIWGVKDNTVYPSEEFMPFSFNPSNGLDVSEWGESQEGDIAWAGMLYIYSPRSIHRLNGTATATFGIIRTPAEQGFINRHTVKATRYGIVGLWHDGIYLFNGTHNVKISTKISDSLFSGMGTKSSCYAEWDGVRYHLIYPTTGTTLNKRLVVDFTNYPELRFFNDDFLPSAYEYHVSTGIKYYGKTDGYQYKESTSETIASSLQTRDMVAKNVYSQKQTEYMYYDINTGGTDVTLTFYVDGVAQARQITLNHSSRTRKRIELPKFEGYTVSVKVDAAHSESVTMYQPWGISFNVPSTE